MTNFIIDFLRDDFRIIQLSYWICCAKIRKALNDWLDVGKWFDIIYISQLIASCFTDPLIPLVNIQQLLLYPSHFTNFPFISLSYIKFVDIYMYIIKKSLIVKLASALQHFYQLWQQTKINDFLMWNKYSI